MTHRLLIADLCNPVLRETDSIVGSIAAYVTPLDMLDWYFDDMIAEKREASHEADRALALSGDIRTARVFAGDSD
jgi:hypothetical protein